MIILDGSHGEGGGQILRTALALSMLTQKPFRIEKIRAGRPKPGLKAQHLTGIRALESLSGSRADGALIGNMELEFHPAPITVFRNDIDVGTAGPITLVLQSVLLPLIFADRETDLTISGGTDVAWSPSIDYFTHVILPELQRFSDIEIVLKRRGYFPRGGGRVELSVRPRKSLSSYRDFKAFQKALMSRHAGLDITSRGRLVKIAGISHAGMELERSDVSLRQAKAAGRELEGFGVPIDISSIYAHSDSVGSGITLWALFESTERPRKLLTLGADALGERGKRAEEVGKEAARKLSEEMDSGAPCDFHLCDNLIPILGLLGGRISTSRITGHIMSNIYVTEMFLNVGFEVEGKIISSAV